MAGSNMKDHPGNQGAQGEASADYIANNNINIPKGTSI